MAAMVEPASLVEFFRERFESAKARQGVETTELASYYVVQLLSSYARPETAADTAPPTSPGADEPLAIALLRALQRPGHTGRAELRRVGDVALFLAGFFSDRFHRQRVDIDYVACLGGHAYSELARDSRERWAEAFAELGERFQLFVDLLTEISEDVALTNNRDVLRLYDRWARTGSLRDGRRLVARGIVPNESLRTRSIQ